MRRTINKIPGRVFRANAHPDFRQVRSLYCFVPDKFLVGGKFDETAFMNSAWPSINCGSNPNGIGSHIFPDVSSPVPLDESTTELVEFLTKLRRYIPA